MLGGKAHYDYDYCYNLHFLSYEIFDQQLKITFRKSSVLFLLKKIHPPSLLFTHSPTKNLKSTSLPFLPTLRIFQAPPAERGGGVQDTMVSLVRMVSFFPILV